MSQAGKRTTRQRRIHLTASWNLEQEQSKGALATKQQIEAYLQRKAEVTQDDHQAFQDYLSQKEQTTSAPEDDPRSRRNSTAVTC